MIRVECNKVKINNPKNRIVHNDIINILIELKI